MNTRDHSARMPWRLVVSAGLPEPFPMAACNACSARTETLRNRPGGNRI